MSKDVEHMSVEELQEKMNRPPTPEEAVKIKDNIQIFENICKTISIKDGFAFIKNLRKEARRQKAMRSARDFEDQVKAIQYVSEAPSQVMEIQLADSFEIYEEE